MHLLTQKRPIIYPIHSYKREFDGEQKYPPSPLFERTPQHVLSLCLITPNSNCELKPQIEHIAMPNDGLTNTKQTGVPSLYASVHREIEQELVRHTQRDIRERDTHQHKGKHKSVKSPVSVYDPSRYLSTSEQSEEEGLFL